MQKSATLMVQEGTKNINNQDVYSMIFYRGCVLWYAASQWRSVPPKPVIGIWVAGSVAPGVMSAQGLGSDSAEGLVAASLRHIERHTKQVFPLHLALDYPNRVHPGDQAAVVFWS